MYSLTENGNLTLHRLNMTRTDKIGIILKKVRLSCGFTQKQLSELSGVPDYAISKIENNKKIDLIRSGYLTKLLEYYKISFNNLELLIKEHEQKNNWR